METPNHQEHLGKFDEYRAELDKFIGFKDVKLFIDEKADTCYFEPKEKKVGIPLKWIEEGKISLDKVFEKLKMKFGIYHEFSHYRDLIKESDISGNESMLKIMQEVEKKKIIIDDGGKKIALPLGNIIRRLYNCIDDIVVNTEVANYIPANITLEAMKSVYQRYLFADYKNKGDGTKISEENKGELNLDGEVDYSEMPLYKAFPFYFLRNYMVSDQKIKLPDAVNSILFNKEGKPNKLEYVFENLIKVFKEKIKSKESDPRYKKLKKALDEQLNTLEIINGNQRRIFQSLRKALIVPIPNLTHIKCSTTKEILVKGQGYIFPHEFSLEDIIGLFAITKGIDHDHHLVVSPKVRYQIIQKIFEPILTTFVLMDLLDADIPEEDNKTKNKGGESNSGDNESDNQQPGSGGEDSDKKDGKDQKEGGKGSQDNRGGNNGDELGNWMKSLEDIIDYQKGIEKEEERKKQSQKIGKSLSDILQSHGLSEKSVREALTSLDKVTEYFKDEIAEFTKMLSDELEKIQIGYKAEKHLTRKGKRANYGAVRKEIGRHLDDGNISRERIWEKNKLKEHLEQEFKKLVFYFMLDVSGSTGMFRGDHGWLNGIAISLAIALHNVEQDIRRLIDDPSYNIPINFIIYANGANLINYKFNTFDEMLAKANYEIVTGDGGTLDITGWKESAKKVIEDFNDNETYVEDIEAGKMKAFVLQIADIDVTANEGVEAFEGKLKSEYGEEKAKEILRGIETKRLILGKVHDTSKELTEQEIEELKKKDGRFAPEYILDDAGNKVVDPKTGKYLIKIKEVGVNSKSEISDAVRKLFENLFIDKKIKK